MKTCGVIILGEHGAAAQIELHLDGVLIRRKSVPMASTIGKKDFKRRASFLTKREAHELFILMAEHFGFTP